MLAFVNIEHLSVLKDPRRAPYGLRDYYQRVINISQAIGMPCHAVHYLDFSRAWLREHDIKAFFISGDVIRAGDVPVMGFCGGHQFIALAFGAQCGPMGPLEPGEVDLMPEYHPGLRKERGFLPMDVLVKGDHLFDGFRESGPVLMESHYWEVCEVPAGFDLLASTKWCRIQMFKHRTLPVYGSQGHAEAYTDDYPDGRRIIRNFAVATGVIRA
jgi:GMP synthase-like glutamine amidotransferase